MDLRVPQTEPDRYKEPHVPYKGPTRRHAERAARRWVGDWGPHDYLFWVVLAIHEAFLKRETSARAHVEVCIALRPYGELF